MSIREYIERKIAPGLNKDSAMTFKESIARRLAPGLKNEADLRVAMADEIKSIVSEAITKAKMDMPISVNYDPQDQGYRRTSDSSIYSRNLFPVQQARMFEICYYMFDASAMFRRLAIIDRGFLFSGPINVVSSEPKVQQVIDRFWNDPENNMAIKFPDKCMWFGILGELCWPVDVNPYDGFVHLRYEDPAVIKEIYVNPQNTEQVMQVEMMGKYGRQGNKYATIRKDYNISSRTYDKLVGDCFFFALNKPPNASRGRSDFMTLVDWIDSLERYGYNYLERAELLLNFVWDVTLEGMDEAQIRTWLRDNPPPEPGSMRAHNSNVTWNAVAPELKAVDFKNGFDMGKAFIMGASGRPESWFGSGGKQYQTEADQANQAPITDLEQRQQTDKFILTQIMQFVIDQAVIVSVLTPAQAAAGFDITMPEISKKDLAKIGALMPQLTTALVIAATNNFISTETATKIFAFVSGHLGYEVDAQAEIDAAFKKLPNDQKDYQDLLNKDGIVNVE